MTEPHVRNVMSGSADNVVQASVIHGDVHLHPPAQIVVPRQLPTAPGPVFAGRTSELAALDDAGATVVVSAIGGAGGIGKTWLAVQWANERLESFPDGQLFVDLRGFSPAGEPISSAVAVRGFLDALGVEPGRMPADPDAQATLYRSLVADRRMLIVLDNAATADQVAPLLPGGRSCTVLITSRKILTGLVVRHGARHLNLDVLADGEAHALLQHRLGTARIAAEPEAVARLLRWCRGFPLALSIVAGPGPPRSRPAARAARRGVARVRDQRAGRRRPDCQSARGSRHLVSGADR